MVWGSLADLVTAGAAVASVLLAIIALVVASRSKAAAKAANGLATEAIDVSRESNTIARESSASAAEANRIAEGQRTAAEFNNSLAQDANELATEAVGISRSDRDRTRRREDELHQVRWHVGWYLDREVVEPTDVVDTRLTYGSSGPDDPHEVVIFFYCSDSLTFTQKYEGYASLNSGWWFSPVDTERIKERVAALEFSDDEGNALDFPPDHPARKQAFDHDIDAESSKLFSYGSELIIRWKSAAGVPHEQSFFFPPTQGRQGWIGTDTESP